MNPQYPKKDWDQLLSYTALTFLWEVLKVGSFYCFLFFGGGLPDRIRQSYGKDPPKGPKFRELPIS